LRFLSFQEFDVRHMQHQPLRAPAFRGEEACQLQRGAEGSLGQEPRLRLEGHGGELGAHPASPARLVLLGLVRDLEVDGGEAAGRVAQRPELKQPAAQL
jgi:hypothetical protein